MLLIRYMLEDYHRQSIESRCDIIAALKQGKEQGLLSRTQLRALLLFIYGYDVPEIGNALSITNEETEFLMNASLNVLTELTGYKDESIIYSYKGEIRPEWIKKSKRIASVWSY